MAPRPKYKASRRRSQAAKLAAQARQIARLKAANARLRAAARKSKANVAKPSTSEPREPRRSHALRRGNRRPLITESRYAVDILRLGDQLRRVRTLEAKREARAKAMRRAAPAEKQSLKQQAAAARRAAYQDKRRLLKAFGMYAPIGNLAELTPSQRAQINRQYTQLEHLLKGATFAEYGKTTKAERRAIKAQARSGRIKTTRRGLFVPREAREFKIKKGGEIGKLYYDKNTGLWEVLRARRYKGKDGKRRTVYERVPIAGGPALEAKRAAIMNRFSKMMPLSRGQRIRFVIQGRNVSKRTFGSVTQLLAYAEKYRKTARGRATFIDSLTIQVVERRDKKRPLRSHHNVRVVDGFVAINARTPRAITKAIGRARRRGVPSYLLEGFEDFDVDVGGDEE